MKQIIINSNNNVVRNFVAEDTDTIYDVLNSKAVLDMFAANSDTIINALVEINSSSVPDAFKNMLINSEVEDGMSLFINLEAIVSNFDTDNEEDNQQEDYNEQHTEAPRYGTVSVYSFNSFGVVSQYSCEIENDLYAKPKKINSAQSCGFSYKSLADTFSDTLDVYHDDFETDNCGWIGATLTNSKAVYGEQSIRGTNLYKNGSSNPNFKP